MARGCFGMWAERIAAGLLVTNGTHATYRSDGMNSVGSPGPATQAASRPPGSWILAPGSLLITVPLLTDYFAPPSRPTPSD